MYQKLPNLVIGFHGCTQDIFERVVYRGEQMKISNNEYDWLGNGVYFWEQSYQRALEWAIERENRKEPEKRQKPAVIGAVLDLGYCLNLTDCVSSDILRRGYAMLEILCALTNAKFPENRQKNPYGDILVRNLDCAVIEQVHSYNRMLKKPGYDSVRGVFFEGEEPYPGSCFKEQTHVQICVRNPNCIKGVFMPRARNGNFSMP